MQKAERDPQDGIFGMVQKAESYPQRCFERKMWSNPTVKEEYDEDIIWVVTSGQMWTDDRAVWGETVIKSSIYIDC